MPCYFAFPATHALRDDSLLLLENFERGAVEPQSALFVRVAQEYADEIVDVLLLDIVRSAEQGHSGARMLEQFAGLIKSTVHALIRQVLGRMDNAELRPLAGYIRERRLTLTRDGRERDYISFPVSREFHDRFRKVLEAGSRGERHPEELEACMLQFSELAHTAFYDDAVRQLKLGFIGRKVVDVGGAAMIKGSRSATRHLVPAMEGEELRQFSAYFLGFLIET